MICPVLNLKAYSQLLPPILPTFDGEFNIIKAIYTKVNENK